MTYQNTGENIFNFYNSGDRDIDSQSVISGVEMRAFHYICLLGCKNNKTVTPGDYAAGQLICTYDLSVFVHVLYFDESL